LRKFSPDDVIDRSAEKRSPAAAKTGETRVNRAAIGDWPSIRRLILLAALCLATLAGSAAFAQDARQAQLDSWNATLSRIDTAIRQLHTTDAELRRNPTVKAELEATGDRPMSGLLLTYPVHQAADILFCKANLVPVGKDQLPHLEQTRVVARRFDERYGRANPAVPVFPQAEALRTQGVDLDYVMEIDVPDEEIIKRMSGRRGHTASGRTYHVVFNPPKVAGKDDATGEDLIQREDDKEETVKKRLEVYHGQTKPLVDFYSKWAAGGDAKAPKYRKIAGVGALDAIKRALFAALA